jgi:hypothetical protein
LAFYRSFTAWLLPWMFVAVILGVGIWITVDALGNDDLPTPQVAGDSSQSPSPTPKVRVTKSPSPTPKVKETAAPESEEPKVELITDNITIQVLNGTGDAAVDDAMANQLTELGFEVVAIQGSSKAYDLTTVFWSYAESQEAAERLAERFGWQVGPKPGNLSRTVAVHVVVGFDYTAQ